MRRTAIITAVLVTAGALFAGGGFVMGRRTAGAPGLHDADAPASAPERKILYWHDPMVPGPRFDKPGKSPFMDMALEPVYADEAASENGVAINPTIQQNLGVRTVVIKRTDVATSFDTVGTVQFDERRSVVVQTRVAGYVERLQVRAPMERVSPGQVLATIFAPEWLGPLNELLALQRSGAGPEMVAAARDRLRALSVPPELIRQSEASGTAQARFGLTAPRAGVVAELGVREGAQVLPGATLFRIAGLDRVWAVAEVPEAQAHRLTRGQKVRASWQADASQAFDGVLQEILPQVDASTRTLQARFEVDNQAGKLVPGMLLRLRVAGDAQPRLTVPAEAVIRTGTRAVAIVRQNARAFEPRTIKLGADLGDQIEVVEGLGEGDEVVVSGQFLVDSEARLKTVLDAMTTMPAMAASAPASAPPHPGGAQ